MTFFMHQKKLEDEIHLHQFPYGQLRGHTWVGDLRPSPNFLLIEEESKLCQSYQRPPSTD